MFVGSWKSRSELRQCSITMDIRNFVDFAKMYGENYEKSEIA